MEPKKGDTIAVWISCGAASAVALKKTVEMYGELCTIRAVNNPIAEEDSDNIRFLHDVSKWCGIEIEYARRERYPDDSAVSVWEHRSYMSGVSGAPCTVELKKRARQEWENNNKVQWHVLGFTSDEKPRHANFIRTERDNVLPVLIKAGLNKQACMDIITQAGLVPPRIYAMGYPNANCIGCVKATSPTYWNLVRRQHPEVFKARAEQSRRLGAKRTRYKGERMYLDELPEHAKGRSIKTMTIECSSFCEEKEL